MFTGLIEQVGRVAAPAPRIRIACTFDDLHEGDSVSVNGCCLTALEVNTWGFSADLASETVARTNLGDLAPGAPVNLERSLRVDARLGGHIVQGHVDGTGEIVSFENGWLAVRVPDALDKYIVEKGSISIDGISLTVAAIADRVVRVAIIPHTRSHTNLASAKPGARVNLEVDILAKYLEKLSNGYTR